MWWVDSDGLSSVSWSQELSAKSHGLYIISGRRQTQENGAEASRSHPLQLWAVHCNTTKFDLDIQV